MNIDGEWESVSPEGEETMVMKISGNVLTMRGPTPSMDEDFPINRVSSSKFNLEDGDETVTGELLQDGLLRLLGSCWKRKEAVATEVVRVSIACALTGELLAALSLNEMFTIQVVMHELFLQVGIPVCVQKMMFDSDSLQGTTTLSAIRELVKEATGAAPSDIRLQVLKQVEKLHQLQGRALGGDELVALLKYGEPKQKMTAAKHITEECGSGIGMAWCQHRHSDHMVEPLVLMLREGTDYEEKKMAGAALSAITGYLRGRGETCMHSSEAICRHPGVFEALIPLLKEGSDKDKGKVAGVIARLATPEIQKKLGEMPGALETILTLFKEGGVDGKKGALWLCWAHARSTKPCQILSRKVRELALIQEFAEFLNDNADKSWQAAGLLSNLAQDNDELLKDLCQTPRFWKSLARALTGNCEGYHKRPIAEAIGTFLRICSCNEPLELLGEAPGLFEELVALLSCTARPGHFPSDSPQPAAARALGCFACLSDKYRQRISNLHNALESLICLLSDQEGTDRCPPTFTKDDASYALAWLALNEPFYHNMEKLGAVESLRSVLSTAKWLEQANVQRTIKGAPDYWKQLFPLSITMSTSFETEVPSTSGGYASQMGLTPPDPSCDP